ncbi:MAG: SulP family inorganic anion transporter [Candidatus Promineifilaceae bacterium]|jgi:SulP family sulfate permease
MTPTGKSKNPSGLARYVPIVQWASKYDRGWLRPDLIAGLTVAALVVPKSLGYAGIANVPIQYGLYAAAAGAVLYALFGTSRQSAVGPSSALAAVAASAIVTAGISSDDDKVALVAAITLLTGIFFILLALFKMGWISQFLSKAVITGFLFGAAIEVVIGELPKLTGTAVEGSNAWQKLFSWFGTLSETDSLTVIVGFLSLVLIFGLRFVAPKIPGALVLVVVGLIASAAFDLGDLGLALVGDVPRGLPSLAIPNISFVSEHLPVITSSAIGLLLIGFSQSAGDARAFGTKHKYRVDINQESFAQGMANVGSGLVQGIPVSTSLSSSSLNDTSGAKTPVASLTTGALVILTLVLLAPLFSYLPNAVLSALIIEAVVMGMMDVPEMRRLHHVKRTDFWIAIAAIFGVLSAGVLAGVIIGIILSIGWLIFISASPSMPELGREPGTEVFLDLGEDPNLQTYPGVLVLRFDGGLFFASADALQGRLSDLAHEADPPLRIIVIDFEGINYIDSQGADTVAEVLDLATGHNIELRLTRLKANVKAVLDRDGVIDRLGEGYIYGNVYGAVVDQMSD